MVTTAATWSIACVHFGAIPLNFLPANVIAIPLLPVYLSIAVFFLTMAAIGWQPDMLAKAIDGGHTLLCRWMQLWGGEEATSLKVDIPSATVWLWIAGIVLLAIFLNSRRKRAIALGGGALLLLSVAAVPASSAISKNSDAEPGIIFADTFRDIAVVTLEDGIEQTHIFPPQRVSALEVGGKSIVSIDCDPAGFNPARPLKCDYLIISKGFHGDTEGLKGKIIPKQIVFHSSLQRRREAKLKAQADSLGIPTLSLRRN